MTENILLVDENNNPIGYMDKLTVHKESLLHRAFSIFIFNSSGQMLIQKRAKEKYHSGGLWTNACCSHQRENEEINEAAHRRMVEEIGFDCELNEIFIFHYKKEFDNGLTENEIDHVYVGTYDGPVTLNPEEAEDYKWIDVDELLGDVKINPDLYTYRFVVSVERVVDYMKKNLLPN